MKHLKRMRNPRGMGALERGNLHKKIVTECKKSTTCYHNSCYAVNGTVKKVREKKRKGAELLIGPFWSQVFRKKTGEIAHNKSASPVAW